jgi:hypothetical protein
MDWGHFHRILASFFSRIKSISGSPQQGLELRHAIIGRAHAAPPLMVREIGPPGYRSV